MNKQLIFTLLALLAFSFSFLSCGDDEEDQDLSLSISGLENLGSDYQYEGWIIVDGSPVSTGVFSVNDAGNLSSSSFEVEKEDLDAATKFVLTIEPNPDPSPDPTDVHIVAGDFSGNSASLSISDPAALNTDFSSAAGTYILATPTDADDSNETSGVWFLDNSSGAPAVGLTLPTLPAGWAYEGWAVIDGTPVSTGTFSFPTGADASAPFSGSQGGPPFPGEDFLLNAPSGLSFPTDLRGGTAVISIEPVPDNSSAPFLLKPLVHAIPTGAADHTAIDMEQNLNFPTGTVNK